MSAVPPPPRRRSLRWIVMLALALLSHLAVFGWVGGGPGLPALPAPAPAAPVVSAALIIPPAPPPAPVAPKPPPKPKAVRPAPPRPRPAAPAAEPKPAAEDAPAQPQEPTDTAQAVPADQLAQSSAPDHPGEAVAVVPDSEAAPETVTAAPHRIDPPPSARLEYDVTALREGQQWYGAGSFDWSAAGDRYRIAGEASVTILFKIAVLNFSSEGAINASGIAPTLYTEKPWRKPLTSTHFDHQQGRISFSASAASYPYQGGEQDRASIAWQLAAIGRGDASRFIPGAELEIMVAGARNADRWRIHIIGEEELTTPHGSYRAWHLRREPRAGGRDQGIDFWLAPQLEWYPVRVRYTYANNDYLDMILTELTPAASSTSP